MTIVLSDPQEAHVSTETIPEQIAAIFSVPEPTRSAKNILLWESYLPSDCVKTMIYMGWDRST
jgi:hypothetical protein